MSRINLAAVAAPEAYRLVRGLETYIRGNLDHTVLELVKVRASMLNGCAFCVDMHTREALGAGEDSRRLFVLAPGGRRRRSSTSGSGPRWR
ncbi:carboxymuconolactone decarboxylase family protein [Micromonospora sp. NPDC050980]|uniref:carboxymuconolactone decarboxylase family protein n=1 Tax=Micromonospora sp. NPDC050980 TaxID=3155161 RepID=UPI0033C44496